MISDADLARRAGAIYAGRPDIALSGEAQVFLEQVGGEFLVGCPGTHVADLSAWLRDFSAWPKWFPIIGPCHAGFGDAATQLWPSVKLCQKFISARLGRLRFVFYGHSLGGAVAQLLTAYFAAELPFSFRLVTFGAPRVAFCLNWQLAPLIRRSAQRVAYQRAGDIVPDLPGKLLYGHRMACQKIGVAIETIDPATNHSIEFYASDLDALDGKDSRNV